MKNPATANANVDSKCSPHLLGIILKYRVGIGDGLTDEEFTRFLREANLPVESGFGFLCYCGGVVALSVPKQQESDWYTDTGRILPAKESIARELAKRHGLVLYEPPDMVTGFCHMPNPHHHLQLNNSHGPVIIAHPQYAKVRLLEASGPSRFGGGSQRAVTLGADLLSELAELYQR